MTSRSGQPKNAGLPDSAVPRCYGDGLLNPLNSVDEDAAFLALRRAESIGRPIGSPEWLAALESRTGRALAPGRRGPKRNSGVK